MKKLLIFLFISIGMLQYANAQTVTGQVTGSDDGQPLPGVNIQVKGTTNGTITDLEGNYTIEVTGDAPVLIFSFVGYMTQEVPVNGQNSINLSLEVETTGLEEIVVTGYGVQKKKVLTGSISSIKSKDLENIPVGRVENTLQGRVAGVTVASNSGQPGSNSTVRVRGITTLNNNDPLWVIDGVVVDNGGIGYINQSDIESVEVLKDASSLAIYGARAANGVILITTKKGHEGKLSVKYDSYYGISSPERKMNLLNATQYATIMNERALAAGNAIKYADPSSYGVGTDWQDAIFNNKASSYSHEVSVSGGSSTSTFYLSFGTRDQDGIVLKDISHYNSKNLRLNSTHKLSKYVTIGQNLGYTHQKTSGVGSLNSEFGGPLISAANLDPITPLVITDPTEASNYYSSFPIMRDDLGRPYGISSEVAQEITNPLAYAKTKLGNYDWSDDFVGNAYIEITPIEGLRLRSTLGGKLAYWGTHSYSPSAYLNANNPAQDNSLYRTNNQGLAFSIENTISYSKTIGDHNFTVLLGQGAYGDGYTKASGVTYKNLPIDNYNDASYNFGDTPDNISAWANEGVEHKVTSLFARVNYNFQEKYLFTGIIRRDGSSRFGSNNKFGYFPSFSLGWVASEENFWPENNIVDNLKFRGGYGITGNDQIGDFAFLSTISSGRNYTFGDQNIIQQGYSPDAPENPDLKWEETSQTNVGFDLNMLRSLNLTFDYFIKKTTGILQSVDIPGYVGATGSPQGNVADMENTGFEIELGYQKRFGEINFSANASFATVSNKVTYVGLGKTEITYSAATFQSMGAVTITKEGLPVNSFYGYGYNGVFQNDAEVEAYVNSSGDPLLPYAQPGDLRWIDQNGDGVIDAEDKVDLGSSLPKYTYGLTLNADYKGFDVMLFLQGAGGNKIFQGLRRLDVQYANYQNRVLERWTGEGTTNSYPRLTDDDANHNFDYMSNLYLEKGDYLRFKIAQIGYSLPSNLINKIGIERLRVYISGENLFTFTKYTGYDPEIGGGIFGIDKGYYPQARTFRFGFNLQF